MPLPSTGSLPSLPSVGMGAVAALLADKSFQPIQPRNVEETGLPETLIDSLICKQLAAVGVAAGRSVAEEVCLSPAVLEDRFQQLIVREVITQKGNAPLGDFFFTLTPRGREVARQFTQECGYHGPVPVSLSDYITAVDAQSVAPESPSRLQLDEAFADIVVVPSLLAQLGPALASGSGLILYGASGNGKSLIAERIAQCIQKDQWIPKTVIAEGEIIKLFDPTFHVPVDAGQRRLLRQDLHDHRWIKIRRPTVVVGRELTLDDLEINHNARVNFSEAPVQWKSNGGSLVIDDFGRQRGDRVELLNRWIVPLEKRYDYLTLSSGKKIQVPFDQLIIFSTSANPHDLMDEAFQRRVPYKIHVPDPDEAEFRQLFERCTQALGCEYNKDAVEHLLESQYRHCNRSLRRCHPRDLLFHIQHYCTYNDLPFEMKTEYFDRIVGNYFTPSHA